MSGGSLHYISVQDLNNHYSTIEEIVLRLHEYGHHKAAERTNEVLSAMRNICCLQVELRDVWHSLECYLSSDSELEDLANAVKDWETRYANAPKRY